MEGNKRVCWAAIFTLTCFCTSALNFTIDVTNKETYTEFLESLRDELSTGNQIYGIPILSDTSTVPDSQRFLLLNLSISATKSITLAMDVADANIVAYAVKNQSYFFNDASNLSIFTDTQKTTLPFGNNYVELEKVAGNPRSKIDLGLIPLKEAINTIITSSQNSYNKPKNLAYCLIVVIQMVSEAAKFKHIEQQVRWSASSSHKFRPDATIRWLETNWEALSASIQESSKGVLFKPIQLQRSNLKKNYLQSVTRELVANLGFILFDSCKQNNYSCGNDFEPTVRIIGRDGLCADVRNQIYVDGNPIQMWPCKSDPTATNQLWSLKKDGTIQSNGKCLTAANWYNPEGSNVTIHDCITAKSNATQWEIWDNGTIINPLFGLVLTAKSGDAGTILTLEENFYASSQGFLASNNTKPFVSAIVGYDDLCMQANGTKVSVLECASDREEQSWSFYPDGSIRPQQKQDTCLTTEKSVKETVLSMVSCSSASSAQRWAFRNDGIVMNLQSGMVMDVRKADPTLEQIIIWPLHGRSNQKWLPLL